MERGQVLREGYNKKFNCFRMFIKKIESKKVSSVPYYNNKEVGDTFLKKLRNDQIITAFLNFLQLNDFEQKFNKRWLYLKLFQNDDY